jgi:rubrerythrin
MNKPDIVTILKAAIRVEEESFRLYTLASSIASSRTILKELAQEEIRHKEKIMKILENRDRILELGSTNAVQDLQIVDFLKESPLSEDADYQTILIFAAKREKNTYEYYSSLETRFKGTEAGKLFSGLAKEELEHKYKLEKEYDEYVLREN